MTFAAHVGLTFSKRVMRVSFTSLLERRDALSFLALAAVLVAGLLTKTGHGWSALALLAVLCATAGVFERLIPRHARRTSGGDEDRRPSLAPAQA